MSNKEKFDYDNEFGRKGEIIAYKHLKSLDYVQSIIDVSGDKHYQKLDVDYIISNNCGGKLWIEVKCDRMAHKTGHIAYEVKSNGNEGCLARSKADLVYYITKTNMYYFMLDEIREHIKITKPELVKMGDGAEGHLLDIKQLMGLGKVHFVKEINERDLA